MAFARCFVVLAILLIISTTVCASKDAGIKCAKIKLKSIDGKPVNKVIVDKNNVQQEIRNVDIWIQLSKLKCVKGINYFYEKSFLIVRGGCAAVFKVCYKKTGVTTTAAPLTTVQPGCFKIRLLSRKAKPVSKDLDMAVTSIRLLQDLHDKVRCEEGVNYRFKDRTVFADGGCRGDFEVCTEIGKLTTPTSQLTCKKITVKSTRKVPAHERVTDSSGEDADVQSVTLIRQISSSVRCKEGRNYFVFGSSILSKKGCQACFRVCYKDRQTTAAPLTTTPLPEQCKRYKVLRPLRRMIEGENDRPVTVTSVTLVREISKDVCREGKNYFYRDSLFVVRGGCKGVFKVFYEEERPAPLTTPVPDKITCKKVEVKSKYHRPGRVDIAEAHDSPVEIVRVKVWDQISEIKCVARVNFFYVESFVIVKDGCQATFKVCYKKKESTTTPAPLTTTPEPEICKKYKILKPTRETLQGKNSLPVDITSVVLKREISRGVCKAGVNFLFQGADFVVNGGCKGVFTVCYRERETTPAPLTTTVKPPITCKKVDAKSRGHKNGRVDIVDAQGNPVTIVLVDVWDQISMIKCIARINYFYFESSIVVMEGCAATFKVCYREKAKATTTPAPLTTTPEPKICKKYRVLEPIRETIRGENSLPAEIISVVIRREISYHVCKEGVNYYFEGSEFVVKRGCKSMFVICYKEGTTTPAPLTTTPEPENCKKYKILEPIRKTVLGKNSLPVDIISVVLKREISFHVCKDGVNYLSEESDFVVNGDCKGVFIVCYNERTTTPAPLTTTQKPSIKCKEVDLKSKHNRPGRVDVVDAQGNPVEIVDVHVLDQISKVKCVEWLTYFYYEDFIVAKKGCEATFKVCYKEKQKPTTTPAPLTTTTQDPEICKKYEAIGPVSETVLGENSMPVDIISVVLKREISFHACKEGENYYFEGSDLVIKGDCKGVFIVCYKERPTTPAPLTTTEKPSIECKNIDVESKHGRPGRVDVVDAQGNPVEIVHVHLLEQLSEVKCIESLTFFYFDSYIVTKEGCGATFKVCYKEKQKPTTTPAPLTTTPEPETCKKYKILKPIRKTVLGENTLPADIISVILEREISYYVCKEGVNYLFDGSDFIVRGGCKGVFTVCYKESTATPAPLTTTTEKPSIECKEVDVVSEYNRPGRIDLVDAQGNPVEIVHVQVLEQLSKVNCIEWLTYFYFDSYIVTKEGCGATFKVCYKAKQKPTTTAAPLTTTLEPGICKKYKVLGPIRETIRGENTLPADIINVSLEREISYYVCEEGVNFFFKGSDFIVKGGCKAVFTICYKERTTTPAPLTTTEKPSIECKEVDVESKYNRPGRIDLLDTQGNPVEIVHVDVLEQISKVKCVEWLTYFYFDSYIVTKEGCGATFKVCYKKKQKQTTTPAPLTTTTSEPEICKRYKILQTIRETILGENFLPVEILSVILEREISHYVCEEGVNYLFDGPELIIKGGCKGVFTVCYKESTTTPSPLTTKKLPRPVLRGFIIK